MADDIQIRPAVAGDAPALAGLIDSVQRLHVAAHPEIFKAVERPELQAWAVQAIAAAPARIVVAECAGVVAGYAVVLEGHRADNAFAYARRWREIDQLCVDPRYQRRGIARALVEYIAAAARDAGFPAVELGTWTFNTDARAAFERIGFVAKTLRYERKT